MTHEPEQRGLASTMRAAADLLDGGDGDAGSGDPASQVYPAAAWLLADLGYDGEDPGAETARHRARLLRAAARLPRLFTLPVRSAPNLVFMGAEASPAALGPEFAACPGGSASGSGETLGQAFESCVGEAVEFLSQFEHDGDLVVPSPADRIVDPFPTVAEVVADPRGGHVAGWRVTTGDAVFLPRHRCLRPREADPNRPPASPPFLLGTGCGAGPSLESAMLHGLFELIERDAVALWWRGGARPRPVAAEGDGVAAAHAYLRRLRGAGDGDGAESGHGRVSWFVDITTDLCVPCVAALSCRPDGRGLACGTASRDTVGAAMRSAAWELCQMELAQDVAAAKERERGLDALNEVDLHHRKRSRDVDADKVDHLHGRGVPLNPTFECKWRKITGERVAILSEFLETRGVSVYAIDLTREVFDISVARIVAPELQLDPCDYTTSRLVSCKNHNECWIVPFPLT